MSDANEVESGAVRETYFLSYSRSDERFALRLARDLRAQGISMWVDQLDIRPSEHWDRAIERAVRDCRGLVVILSPRSVASDNVADEISFAIDSGKSVLPVMIERCTLPLRITRMHVVDATGAYAKALQQCLGELKRPAARPGAAQPVQPGIDSAIVAQAKQQLAAAVGPIASLLVDKAAARARSADELYGLLVQHIDNERDRERFAASLAAPPAETRPSPPASGNGTPPAGSGNGSPPAPVLEPAQVEAVARVLTRYLGPIAPVVARRESRACSSLDELRQRLAAKIPKSQDKAEFLRQARSSPLT